MPYAQNRMNAFFEIQEKRARLLPIEVVTLGYTLFTALLIFYFWPQMEAPWRLLMGRAMIVIALGGIWGLNYAAPCEATRILRNIFPLTILGYWYSDTYEFNRLFDNLDYIFAAADYDWFGSQPSLVFRQLLPGKGWSELFHFGYFSYFPMIVTTTLLPYFVKRDTFERYAFVIIASFFLYYVVFLFLPVAGPQYYFHAVGLDKIHAGIFPQLHDYFRYHTELHAVGCPEGLFQDLVELTQSSGERPTAAFPSSHVGISTLLMIILFKTHRKTVWAFLPVYLLLCCSTVYIEAHYLVDVFGGLISGVLFYVITNKIYTLINTHKIQSL